MAGNEPGLYSVPLLNRLSIVVLYRAELIQEAMESIVHRLQQLGAMSLIFPSK